MSDLNSTTSTKTPSVFTDDERLFLNGMFSNLYYMDGTVGVINGDAREPIITGLHKLSNLYSDESSIKRFLKALAVMIYSEVELHINHNSNSRYTLRLAMETLSQN